ncbi:hypothetical protein DOTSEDRAFT_122382, partial [Dothistroma septosporum NZE10]
RNDLQDTLSARWTHRIPFLQKRCPAEIVADIINETLRDLSKSSPNSTSDQWKIIDFCSGSGGPIPLIESLINQRREDPIPFLLTDPNPNLDSFIAVAAKSDGLSFIPQPVSAANPPFAVISTTTRGDKDASARAGYETDGRKVFRTFCGSFHRFDDGVARKALRSTMETSDAVVIVEMQDSRVGGLILVLLEVVMSYLMAVFWFWHDKTLLLFTYVVPILPIMHILDGVARCLRTRSLEEILELIPRSVDNIEKDGSVVIRDWRFKHSRILHTWPLGYMNVITGTSLSPEPA